MKNDAKVYNITLKGYHNYFTPFILTNIYGIDMFNMPDNIFQVQYNVVEQNEFSDLFSPLVRADALLDDNYYEYDNTKRLATYHSTYLPLLENINKSISSHNFSNNEPKESSDYTREIQFKTVGKLDGDSIVYGEAGNEMRIVLDEGCVSLERNDRDGICLFFEQGKRTALTVSSNVFDIIEPEAYFQISLETLDLKADMQCEKPFIEICYTVDINGFRSERTQFILTIEGENKN